MAHAITTFAKLNELFEIESFREGRKIIGEGTVDIYAWNGKVIQNADQYVTALYDFFNIVFINGYRPERGFYAARYKIPFHTQMEWERLFEACFENSSLLTKLLNR